MNAKFFVDTNILLYAHDIEAGRKYRRANELLRGFWEDEGAILSMQVLQEFYVNVTRKIPTPISPASARGVIDAYRAWQIEPNTVDTLLQASEYQERHQLSFWDAMIVAAAVQGRAVALLTEDLNPGQIIEGIEIRNPLVG